MVNQSSAARDKGETAAMETLRRRVKPFEHVGVLGFFVLTAAVFFLLFCLVGWRYGLLFPSRMVGGGGGGGVSALGLGLAVGGGGRRAASAAIGGGGGGECDWFDGEWVWDESYPLYQSKDCPFIDQGFRCSENGRADSFYTKWRWRPSRCDLPRFNAKKMLKKLRNRRLVFVGDSIGRNQWESLLCMLSMAVRDKSSIYEVNGSPITKHNGFLVFRFRDYNCTVEYYRTPFLVAQGRAPAGVPEKVKTTVRLDIMDWMSGQWRDADVLIFNTGHWWNYEKTIRGGNYFQEGAEVKMEMSAESAYQRSIQTLFNWIHKEINMSRTQVIFRTYAPVHFRGGDWKTGGSCHLETLPELSSSPISLKPWAHLLKPFKNASKDSSTNTRTLELDVLNVTQMTAQRKDGHSSLFYLGPSVAAPLHRQDCSHWCLPGVPDAWNELLYALILRRASMMGRNIKTSGTSKVKLN